MQRNGMEIETRTQKIKKHLRDNRGTYVASAISAVIATAVTALYFMTKDSDIVVETGDGDNQTNFIAENINYLQRVSNYGNTLGAPGKEVVDLDTAKVYRKVKYAALDAGVSTAMMSNHLHEKTDTVNGRRFAFVTRDEDYEDE